MSLPRKNNSFPNSLRILFLSHKFCPDIGGIEINSEILAKAFCQAGHEVHLVTWSEGLSDRKFPFIVIRNPGKRRLFQEHKWAHIIFENNPCIRLAWPNLFFRQPLITVLNTWISRADGSFGIQDWIKLKWLKRADKVIAVSDAVRKRCWPAAAVISNPYRDSEFKILPEISRTRDFVFLGRLVSDKGADHAIQAVHRLKALLNEQGNEHTKITLTIIGQGPEEDKLKQLVAGLDLISNVHFAGTLRGKDLVVCLNRHRFILVPSIWEEPFGNIALEGLACGCLPVVSDGGGLPDAVGAAGLTFQRGNIPDLVNSIQRIMNNENLEKQIRMAATPHLLAHQATVISGKYLKVIESAILPNK